MKKLIAFFLVISLVAALAGCAGTTVVIGNCTCPTGDKNPSHAPAEGSLKTGIAVVTSLSKSKGTENGANGVAEYDVTIAAVTVDDGGVIRSCIIDSVGTTVKFDAAGMPVDFDPAAKILTKNELGDDYNMKLYGGAKYEWYQQAAALAKYAEGKTVAELRAGAVNEEGKASDVDLAATATIYLAGYVSAIEKAVANAQHLGAQAGEELKLAVINTMKTGTNKEGGGNAELTVDVTAITMNGKTITSCAIDSVQAKVAFDGKGAVTTDLSAPVPTKNELGDAYNMVIYGGAKYEWYEQAASFAQYVTGKTAAEVAGIAVTEATKPESGTDLAATVTIAIGGFQALIAKAAG